MKPCAWTIFLAPLALASCLALSPRDSKPEGNWAIRSINGAPIVSESNPGITFQLNGDTFGNTGCNRFRGNYTQEKNHIHFGPMASTKKLCIPTLNQQERAILNALENAYTLLVEGDTLTLSDADGQMLVSAQKSTNP